MESKKVKRNKNKEETSEDLTHYCATIESLPIEVLSQIFQYLPHVERLPLERVCRKWQIVARDTWRSVNELYIVNPRVLRYNHKFGVYKGEYNVITVEDKKIYIGTDSPSIIRCALSRFGQYATTFTLDYWNSSNIHYILPIITEYCNNIEDLRLLTFTYYNKRKLSNLFEANKKLHSISCDSSTYFVPIRNWKSLRLMPQKEVPTLNGKIIELIKNSEFLEELKMVNLQPKILDVILRPENLKILHFRRNLTNCSQLYCIANFKNLTSLTIEISETTRGFHDLLVHLSQNLENLRKLALSVSTIEERTFEILDFKKLKTFEITCQELTNKMLMHLIPCHHLKLSCSSNIHDFEDGLPSMLKKCENLETLDLSEIYLRPSIFRELVTELNERINCLKIKIYNLFPDNIFEICKNSKIEVVHDL